MTRQKQGCCIVEQNSCLPPAPLSPHPTVLISSNTPSIPPLQHSITPQILLLTDTHHTASPLLEDCNFLSTETLSLPSRSTCTLYLPINHAFTPASAAHVCRNSPP